MKTGTRMEQGMNEAAEEPPGPAAPGYTGSSMGPSEWEGFGGSRPNAQASGGIGPMEWEGFASPESRTIGPRQWEGFAGPEPGLSAEDWLTYSRQMGGGRPKSAWEESLIDLTRGLGRYAREASTPEGSLGLLGQLLQATAGKTGERLKKAGEEPPKPPPYRGPVVNERGKPLDPPAWLTPKQKEEFLARQNKELARRKKEPAVAGAW